MIKSASLLSAALLVFGLAAGDISNSALAADVGAPGSDAPKAVHKHKSSHRSSHKTSHRSAHKTSHKKSKKTAHTDR